MKISVYGATDPGKVRDHNEDAFAIFGDLDNSWQEINNRQMDLKSTRGMFFVVADGMGGTNAGEIASTITVAKIEEKVRSIHKPIVETQQIQKTLVSGVFEAHNAIVKKANTNQDTKGMGTTIVNGCIVENSLYIAWAGDSRVYHYNKSWNLPLRPFSDDHSLVWNKVRTGEITPEQARLSRESNLILNAIGDAFHKPVPEFKCTELGPGDRIIVCSDGLNSMLSDAGIQQIIDFNVSTEEACTALIQAANNAGGRDNITVLIIDILTLNAPLKDVITRKQASKKKPWLFLISISIGILVAVGLYYLNKIKADGNNNEKPPLAATSDSPSQQDAKKTKSELYQPSGNEIKLAKIQTDMQFENYRIEKISNELNSYIQKLDDQKSDSRPATYSSCNKMLHQADSLKTLISSFADSAGNITVTSKNRTQALKVLSTLKTSVDHLTNSKNKLLNQE